MKKEFACLKRPWKSTNNASSVLILFPNGTLSSGLRLHKRSGILFMTDYLSLQWPVLRAAIPEHEHRMQKAQDHGDGPKDLLPGQLRRIPSIAVQTVSGA
jgi:hypothetical protein